MLAISGSVLTAPVALPTAVISVAGYVAVAGGVLSAVSQVTVEEATKLFQDTENNARDGN